MNGAPWYDTAHHLFILGGLDASSTSWGGVVRGPPVQRRSVTDFPAERVRYHINVVETSLDVLRVGTLARDSETG